MAAQEDTDIAFLQICSVTCYDNLIDRFTDAQREFTSQMSMDPSINDCL